MKFRMVIASMIVAIMATTSTAKRLSAQTVSSSKVKHQTYAVVVLPPNGGPDSFLAGYLFPYAPLTNGGTVGAYGDTSTGANNSYIWTNGKQVDLEALPQLSDLTGTGTYINWINQWGLAAGYGTRTNTATQASLDNAAIWFPNGQIFPLKTPEGGQSHAVWINDFGQASGWIAPNSIADPCAFGVGLQSQGVVWEGGFVRPLGTLGGTDSYGEFINDLGQISGHSQTSNVVNSNIGCPPFDPFIWQNGKMTDINPGNFGGAEGGTNFLNNQGQAVGFGTLPGEAEAHPFLWNRGKLTDLYNVGNLGGPLSSAINVNDVGHVVGLSTTADGAFLAVLWRDGEFTNLMTLSADGDDCSEPYRINSLDQIVGVSFSCETGVEHAFLWEGGQMEDLNTLIPADSGLELESANWINDDGVIAAQAVLTQGDNSGDFRAVLLIPTGEWFDDTQTVKSKPASSDAMTRTPKMRSLVQTRDGRVNPILLRPFAPAVLVGKSRSDRMP